MPCEPVAGRHTDKPEYQAHEKQEEQCVFDGLSMEKLAEGDNQDRANAAQPVQKVFVSNRPCELPGYNRGRVGCGEG